MFLILAQCPLFHRLNHKRIDELLSQTFHKVKTIDKNETIAYSGDICNRMLILIDGSVRGEMTDFSGKIIKIEDIAAPRPLAPAFLFGVNNTFPVNIVTNTTVTYLEILRDDFLSLMQQDSNILQNYLNLISNRAQFLSDKIRFLNFKTIKGKFAMFLLQHTQKGETILNMPLSQEQLAEMFGVTRPALARVIGDLETENIIKVDRKLIQILDRKALAGFVN